VTQTGRQQNHFLAVSGGSASVNYHFGVGFNQEKGIYIGDEQKRYNFKGSVDAKINKVISAGFSVNVASINNHYADDNAIQEGFRANPFMAAYDAEGNIIHNPGLNTAFGTDGNQFTSAISPLDLMKSSKTKRETWRILGNFYLKFDILKGLDFKTTFSPNYTSYRHGYFDGYVNPVTGNAYRDDTNGYDGKEKINQANVTNYRNFSWTWDNVITYNTTIAKDHNIIIFLIAHPRKTAGGADYFRNDDVAGSSDVTNLADTILNYTMPRVDDKNPDPDPGDRVLQITKNRLNGKLERKGIKLWYDDASKRISEVYGKFDWELGWETEQDFEEVPEEFELPFGGGEG
jgi:hypothetical protein